MAVIRKAAADAAMIGMLFAPLAGTVSAQTTYPSKPIRRASPDERGLEMGV